MAALDVAGGTSLFVYPNVARHQKSLYRELVGSGLEIALHLNGRRYSRLPDHLVGGKALSWSTLNPAA